MVGAIGTLVVATGYFTRAHLKKDAAAGAGSAAVVDEEKQAAAAAAAAASEESGEHLHVVHTHATHGHAHGSAVLVAAVGGAEDEKDTVRHRVISQVGNNFGPSSLYFFNLDAMGAMDPFQNPELPF
jgi:zinc transporter 1/2/3